MFFTLSEVLRGCYPPITFRDLFNSLYYTEAETPRLRTAAKFKMFQTSRSLLGFLQREGHTESNVGYLPDCM